MPSIVARGSFGYELLDDDSILKYQWRKSGSLPGFSPQDTKNIKTMVFSHCGSFLAWSNGTDVKIAMSNPNNTFNLKRTFDIAGIACINFSPLGGVVALWKNYGNRDGTTSPNLFLFSIETGNMIKSFYQKQIDGWCPQWMSDEKMCCRSVTNEVHFYADGNFETISARLHSSEALQSFSKAPNGPNIVCFYPGKKGAPSFAKFFVYPQLKEHIACRSFFQADSMEVEWNDEGSVALVIVESDVDRTGASYYGRSQLHMMNAAGDAMLVHLPKNGPVYCVKWRHSGEQSASQFVVVYGFMPAKVTLYNARCQKVFDYGTGPRNVASFNRFGNLLLIGGFGNLPGLIEIWDMNLNKRVSKFEAVDTTAFEWCPDGQRILTSTCAPRLRQGNGFRIWHYTSSLLFSHDTEKELWQVLWENVSSAKCSPFRISYTPVASIKPLQTLDAPKEAYRPPCMRGGTPKFINESHYEPAESVGKEPSATSQGKPVVETAASKRNRKRREAKKTKDQETSQQVSIPTNGGGAHIKTSLEKKMAKLESKLNDIRKLKEQHGLGKLLELNQMNKIKNETAILAEIAQLKI